MPGDPSWDEALREWDDAGVELDAEVDAAAAAADAAAKRGAAKRPRESPAAVVTKAAVKEKQQTQKQEKGGKMAAKGRSAAAAVGPIPKVPASCKVQGGPTVPAQAAVASAAVAAATAAAAAPSTKTSTKILSLNVAGLRGLLKNETRASGLQALLLAEAPDILCLQEHKLQEGHIAEHREALAAWLPGYEQHWSASTANKGYSGTATLVRAGLEAAGGVSKLHGGRLIPSWQSVGLS
jgi:hypothetical protein